MQIPNAVEVAGALEGAWRLACRDPDGMRRFDGTLDSFWKSFFAAVVSLPFFALLVLLRDLPAEPRGGMGVVLVVEAIAYVATWAAFPLAMLYVARALQRQNRYLSFMAAFNWSAVIQVVLFALATGIAASDLLPEAIAQGIAFGVTMLVLIYEWYVIRVGLAVGGLVASAVVMLDLAVGIIVNGVAQSIYL